MITMHDFGIRLVPPCSDCYEDGHCSMNCSAPNALWRAMDQHQAKIEEINESLPRQTAKARSEIVCHCCLGLSPKECGGMPTNQCDGLRLTNEDIRRFDKALLASTEFLYELKV